MGVEADGLWSARSHDGSHMTLEELLHRAYGVAMTPLPPPPQLTPEQWARMKASAQSSVGGLAGLLPSLPEGALPLAPQWMQRYMEERGLAPWQEDGPAHGGGR